MEKLTYQDLNLLIKLLELYKLQMANTPTDMGDLVLDVYFIRANVNYLDSLIDKLTIEKLKKSQYNWRAALRRYTASQVDSDIRNARNKRNKRYGFMVPGKRKKFQPKIVTIVDTSGSMSQKDLEQAMGELEDIRRRFNAKVYVLDCDANVHSSRWINPHEPLPVLNGGGGTDFRPVFEHITEQRLKPDYVVFFTDGYGSLDRKSTRLNSSHSQQSRMPSSA